MATNNLILGTASKSLGDITLFRRDGRQMARARVRVIANPRSEAQSETRNFLAPVTKFYAPLSSVLAKSWEGCNKAKSHAMFLKTNIDLARRSGWWLDKGTPFYPLPYQLSCGRITPLVYEVRLVASLGVGFISIDGVYDEESSFGTLSSKLVLMGYQNGDVVTIIVVIKDANGIFRPAYTQFTINTRSSADFSALTINGCSHYFTDDHLAYRATDGGIAAIAAIVARKYKGEWLRSTQFLSVDSSITTQLVSEASRRAAITSYSNPESNTGGDVYIDGDGQAYNVATVSGRALLFYGGQYNAKVFYSESVPYIMLKPANVDTYFFLQKQGAAFIGTNSNASLQPSDWRGVTGLPSSVTAENNIAFAQGDAMFSYLQSIGYTGA